MHKTRIGSLVIDCHDMPAGLDFWKAALGATDVEGDPHSEHVYVSLGHVVAGLRLLLQRVPEQKAAKSRLHLDIETDDVEAEVSRLTSLGATVSERQEDGGAVMLDANDNEFCVIHPETPGFPEGATTWPA